MTTLPFFARLRALFVLAVLLLPTTVFAQSSGLAFTFDHLVVADDRLTFDVMVEGDQIRLGDTHVVLDYNALGFGTFAADGVTARPGPALYETGYYNDPVASDAGPSKLALAMDFVGAAGDGVLLGDAPVALMRVTLPIADPTQSSGLMLDGLLMAGLQQSADGLAVDLVQAVDSANEQMADATTGIEFLFANCDVNGNTLTFDVEVRATAEGTRLGDTQVYLNYNELGFGQAVDFNNNISATLGDDLAANGSYRAPVINDNTASRVALTIEYVGSEGQGILLPTTPVTLLRVSLQIQDPNESAGLSFEERLMDGQQFHDDQATTYTPVIAVDTKDEPLSPQPTGLTFTFENCVIVNGRLVFDVMVRAGAEGTRLGDTQVYLNYNDLAFGQNVIGNGNITVTRGTPINNSNYLAPLLQDNTPAKASITVEFIGNPEDGTPVPAGTKMQLLHVEMTIQDDGNTAGLSFDELLMAGNQFESDNTLAYDPVVARDVKDDPLRDPVGITFTFGNCDVTANGIEFDVFVRADQAGTFLGDSQVYLNYNAMGFGPAVATNGNISVSLAGDFASTPGYQIINVVDNTADRVAITVDYEGAEANAVPLPTGDIALLHVVIAVQNPNETAGLGFEQSLMGGQQFEANEEIAYDPVVAADTKDPVLRDHIGLTFTFANCVVTANGLEFDIQVQGDFADTRLGDVQVYLDYNTVGFGSDVETNGNISATLAPAFAANGNYAQPIINDNTASKVSLAVEYLGQQGEGEVLPDTPITILHVVMEIQDPNENAGINFDQGLMVGQQFEDDQATQYDPVRADDPKNDPLRRQGTGITYTLANCRAENGRFVFDVLIQADEAGRRLGDTQVYLDYNAAGFGASVDAAGRISASLGPALAGNGNYLAPIINDNTGSKVSLTTEFVGSTGDGVSVPTSPLLLMTVSIEYIDGSQNSGLNFDQTLMGGNQFEDDQTTVFTPVRADDTSCDVPIDPPVPTGITYTFDNCRIVDGKFVFDVMVAADDPDTRLGDTQVYLNYNDVGFGQTVATNGNISASLGPLFASNGNYLDPFINDNTASRVSLTTEFTGGAGNGVPLPTSPVVLMTVEMTIEQAQGQSSGLNFHQPLMAGQQFEDDQATQYDPVRADDASCDVPLEPPPPEPSGLTFTFDNCRFENGTFFFDVLVAADSTGRRLGDAQAYLNYNTAGFGANVAANGKITASIAGPFAANANYVGPFANDNTASRVSLAVEFVGSEGAGTEVPTTPTVLMTVQIEIADPNETAGLTFEQALMAGQQFEDDQMTAFDPVRAADEECKDAPLGERKEAIGLTFTFENCQVENGKFSFDVMIAADEAGRALGDTDVYLDYDELGFGPNASATATVLLGSSFAANGNYGPPVASNTGPSQLRIQTAYNGGAGNGVAVPTTSLQLLHVELDIADAGQNSGLNFAEAVMQGRQEEDDETVWSPVRADDTSCDVPLGRDPIGLHFSFENCRVENDQLKFDVVVTASEDGRLLGDTDTYLNYNEDGFGAFVVANGNVMATLGPALAGNGNYGPIVLADNTASRFSATIAFTGEEAEGIAVGTTPTVLFSVMMDFDRNAGNGFMARSSDDDDDDGHDDDDDDGHDDDDDDGHDDDDDDGGGTPPAEASGVSFEQPLMEGRQYESDNTTPFDPVTTGPGCDIPLDDEDDDNDGVPDEDDFCEGTEIPEDVPTVEHKSNRWALVDADHLFDTVHPNQDPKRTYTITDTGGCSCEQIIENLDLGDGHRKHGCSNSAMDDWIAIVNGSHDDDYGAHAYSAKAAPAPAAAGLGEMVKDFVLDPAYPNPFNPQATIRFAIKEASQVQVVLYDALGQRVRVLYAGTPPAGTYHELTIDGSALASGTYFVRLVGPRQVATQVIHLVK